MKKEINEKLVEKIHSAVLDMMKRVEFVDNKKIKHAYIVKETGEYLQGVSTVSSILPKDWLSAWGAKEAVKFLGYSDYDGEEDILHAEEVIKKIIDLDEEYYCNLQGDEFDKIPPEESEPMRRMEKFKKYQALLKEAKGACWRKSKKALVDGTAGHLWLEGYVKAKIRGTDLPEVPTDNLERPIEQFLKWEFENIDYWILSEARVCYPEKGYAGTLDGFAMMKTGKLAVVDYKFATHLSSDYKLQCSGYSATFEPYGIKVEERIIIRFPKTLEIEEWNPKTRKYSMILNNLEVMRLDNSELERDIFFTCLPLKKWINSELKKS